MKTRVLLLLAAAAALYFLGRYAGGYVPRFAEWVNGLGLLGPAVFIAGYAVATVAFIPGSLLTLAAGAIFGVAAGVFYVYIGAVLGSSAAFLICRNLAREFIKKKIEAYPRFSAVERAVSGQGLKLVFLLRLSPLFPYNLLNYALGLTRVSFRDYLLASFGMIPGTLLYVYSGKVAGDVAALAAGAPAGRGPFYYTILVIGFLATIAATALVTKVARRALAEATGEEVPAPGN